MKPVNEATPARPWHKEYFVWFIIFFPLLAVIGGVVTIILAVKSNDGLVVDDYYKKGLEINRVLERDKNAIGYQLSANIKINHKLEEVIININANDSFTYPAELSVSFLHATRAGLDKDIRVLLTDQNNYKGNLSNLAPGKWYVHIQYDNWRIIKTIRIN